MAEGEAAWGVSVFQVTRDLDANITQFSEVIAQAYEVRGKCAFENYGSNLCPLKYACYYIW